MFIYLVFTVLEVVGAANKCSVVQHDRVVGRWQEGLTHWDAPT